MGEKTSQNDVVRDPSVGTPILVPNVQIGDLVGANYYRKDSLRSDSVPPTNPAARPWIYNTRILNHSGYKNVTVAASRYGTAGSTRKVGSITLETKS